MNAGKAMTSRESHDVRHMAAERQARGDPRPSIAERYRDRDDYLAHLKPIGQMHRLFFGAYYPAMALFEISRFFQDEALIEIEGLAVIDQ